MGFNDRRRLRRAEKACRLDEVRALREEFGVGASARPRGASSSAVVIASSRRFWSLYSLGWGVVLMSLALVGFLTGSGSILGVVGAGALGLGIGGLHAAGWWGRICFDGPRIWTGGLFGGWTGPTDLRTVCAYTEPTYHAKHFHVALLTPDPAGRLTSVKGMKFSDDVVERLDPKGPFAVQRIRVGDLVSKEGLGGHLLRHLDRDRCEFGGSGQLWRAAEKAEKRSREEV